MVTPPRFPEKAHVRCWQLALCTTIFSALRGMPGLDRTIVFPVSGAA